MRNRLLSPDPADPAPANDPTPAPAPAPTPTPAATPPPAASTVVNGKTERELQLEHQLAESQKVIKERETRISEVEDENRRVKEATTAPREKKKKGFSFLRPLDTDDE
jgi:translation initiation factor IF-2